MEPEIDKNTIVLKVPELETKEFEERLLQAKNNFERTKLEREIELEKLTREFLVQIQYRIVNHAFELPIYFETVPHTTSSGTILEFNFTTLVNCNFPPMFIGKTRNGKNPHIIVKSPVPIPDNLFTKVFSIENFDEGKFSISILISYFRSRHGVKILSLEGAKETQLVDDILIFLNNHEEIMKLLKKFPYRSSKRFKPVDLPKNKVNFGNIGSECIGCIIPVSEKTMMVQIGGFGSIDRTQIYPLFKQLVVTLKT